jgi:predicted Zn-dependent protease
MALPIRPGRVARRLLLLTLLLAPAACDISEDEEVALGRENAAQVERQLPLVEDAEVNAYVQELGLRLAHATDRPDLDWHFRVVDTPEMNAFALPGGFIYVNRGLIERTRTMSELAGVLGHEVGHVALRHSVDQLEKRNATGVGIAVVCTVTGWCADPVAQVAIDVGASAIFATHSRGDESEADSAAVETLVRAGVHPEGVPALFETLLAERQRAPAIVETWFASHPLEESRITATREQIQRTDPYLLERLAGDDAGFARLKARLAELPAPPRPAGAP